MTYPQKTLAIYCDGIESFTNISILKAPSWNASKNDGILHGGSVSNSFIS